MAKKKKTSKNEKSTTPAFSVELTGLVLILIGIIGFGFGPVGALLKKFAMFLLGEWWPVILLLVLFLGLLMLFKRKMPNFMSQRAIGLYLIIIVVLIMSHLNFVKMIDSPGKIFEATMNNYMDRIASIGMNNAVSSSGQTSISIGGGIFGAVFSFGSASLFGLNGTYIVLVFLFIFGVVLLFNVNLSEVLSRIVETFKWAKETVGEDSDDSEERSKALEKRLLEQEEDIEPKKSYVVESVEEIKPKMEEEVNEEPRLIMPDLPNANPNAPTINLNYKLPPMSILDDPERSKKINSNQFLINNKQNLERVLSDFHITGKVVDVHMGPSVTQFELTVPSGTKVSRISSINKEIALALAARL